MGFGTVVVEAAQEVLLPLREPPERSLQLLALAPAGVVVALLMLLLRRVLAVLAVLVAGVAVVVVLR